MKKILLLISLFVLLSNISFSQVGLKENDTLINYVDINKKKQGKWHKKYKNGKTRYKGQFINDIPVGTFNYYYDNGKIKSIMNYKDQTGFSTVEMYWEKGN